MKVSVLRGGGIGGMLTRTELDSEALPAADAEVFERRIREAHVLDADPPAAARPGHPDELAYEIDVDEGERRRTFRASEETTPEPLRALIEWIDSRPERDVRVEPPG
jgi:hypothetical protein